VDIFQHKTNKTTFLWKIQSLSDLEDAVGHNDQDMSNIDELLMRGYNGLNEPSNKLEQGGPIIKDKILFIDTNFNISQFFIELFATTPGLERTYVVSRYSMVTKIGELFQTDKVVEDVNFIIKNFLKNCGGLFETEIPQTEIDKTTGETEDDSI
jgi:hypothetical protein